MERKWTHVMFAIAGLIVAWLLAKCGDWAWSYFGGKSNAFVIGAGAFVIAGTATIIAWRNEMVFGLASEVAGELRKVSWPSRKEVLQSTIVVIITTIISSAFLGVFDATWAWVTKLIYGGS
jgi:preprotein translocase subunit SecE